MAGLEEESQLMGKQLAGGAPHSILSTQSTPLLLVVHGRLSPTLQVTYSVKWECFTF